MKKKAALHNLGCKVNAYETEAMQELLEQNGYEIVPFKEGADVYIINTCTVTNVASANPGRCFIKHENEPGCGSCGDRLIMCRQEEKISTLVWTS